MSSPGDDEYIRNLMRAAATADQVELDVQRIMQGGAEERYHTDAEFHARVWAVANAVAAVSQGTNPVLASLPQRELVGPILGEVAAFLAIDDYFSERWEAQGTPIRRGPHPVDEV